MIFMNIEKLIAELRKVTGKISKANVNRFLQVIKKANRVYVMGEGRSGLVAKSFAMRLARLGKIVYVVGETVTPAVGENDLLIAISGSGETKTVLETVKISRVMRAKVVCLTASPDSPLTKLSHLVIVIPAQLPKRLGNIYQLRELIGVPERPPQASMFELASLMFLEVTAFNLEKYWQTKNKPVKLLPS